MTQHTPILHTKCPICNKNSSVEYKPFCSKRCADVDLGNWLNGKYAIPTNETPKDGNSTLPEELEDEE